MNWKLATAFESLQHYDPTTIARETYLSSVKPSLVDLRGQVELHEALVFGLEEVLHQERRVRGEAQGHRGAERRGFREVHQVPECKGRGHRLVHGQGHLKYVGCFSLGSADSRHFLLQEKKMMMIRQSIGCL